MKDSEFEVEMEIDGDSEQHDYAMDLIRNLIKVSSKDLYPQILSEVMMVYSISWNMVHGDKDLILELFPQVLSSIEDGSDTRMADLMEEEKICH